MTATMIASSLGGGLSVIYREIQSLSRCFHKAVFYPLLTGRGSKTAPNEFWTAPNAISMSRIALAILSLDRVGALLPLQALVLAAYTDHLDGVLADMLGKTKWGKLIDPACDKFYVACFLLGHQSQLSGPAVWGLLAVEFALFLWPFFVASQEATKKGRLDLGSNIWGKCKLTVEFAAIGLAACGYWWLASMIFCWLALPLAAASLAGKFFDRQKAVEVAKSAAAS